MVQQPSTNQEPSPALAREARLQPAPMAQFSQATAEGERAAAIGGHRPLSGGLVHYVTTSW